MRAFCFSGGLLLGKHPDFNFFLKFFSLKLRFRIFVEQNDRTLSKIFLDQIEFYRQTV